MRKLILTVVLVLAGLTLMAQGRVSTRKYVLNDFSDKITKVVLPGNDLLDGAMRQEVVSNWILSPFEFCTTVDFERLKKSPDYYFLLAGASMFKGETEPSLVFLTLVKGGPGAQDGTRGMHEVVSLPLCSAGHSSGRELIFLGAMIEAVQSFTEAAMESEKAAYLWSDWFNHNYAREGKMMTIWLSEDDIDKSVQNPARFLDEDFRIVSEDQADSHYLSGDFNTLCGYVVAPMNPVPGSWCYKMLFEANTHRLFFISRHKISETNGAGFLTGDLRKIARRR